MLAAARRGSVDSPEGGIALKRQFLGDAARRDEETKAAAKAAAATAKAAANAGDAKAAAAAGAAAAAAIASGRGCCGAKSSMDDPSRKPPEAMPSSKVQRPPEATPSNSKAPKPPLFGPPDGASPRGANGPLFGPPDGAKAARAGLTGGSLTGRPDGQQQQQQQQEHHHHHQCRSAGINVAAAIGAAGSSSPQTVPHSPGKPQPPSMGPVPPRLPPPSVPSPRLHLGAASPGRPRTPSPTTLAATRDFKARYQQVFASAQAALDAADAAEDDDDPAVRESEREELEISTQRIQDEAKRRHRDLLWALDEVSTWFDTADAAEAIDEEHATEIGAQPRMRFKSKPKLNPNLSGVRASAASRFGLDADDAAAAPSPAAAEEEEEPLDMQGFVARLAEGRNRLMTMHAAMVEDHGGAVSERDHLRLDAEASSARHAEAIRQLQAELSVVMADIERQAKLHMAKLEKAHHTSRIASNRCTALEAEVGLSHHAHQHHAHHTLPRTHHTCTTYPPRPPRPYPCAVEWHEGEAGCHDAQLRRAASMGQKEPRIAATAARRGVGGRGGAGL